MVDDHGQTDCIRHYLAKGQVLPADVRGVNSDSLLRVHDPGNHKAHGPYSVGLRYLRLQFGDGVDGCFDDGVRAEVSGRWPLAGTVVESI